MPSCENVTGLDGLAAGWTGHFLPAFLWNLLTHFQTFRTSKVKSWPQFLQKIEASSDMTLLYMNGAFSFAGISSVSRPHLGQFKRVIFVVLLHGSETCPLSSSLDEAENNRLGSVGGRHG